MLCPDKILKADGRKLFADTVDIDAQGIVIHVKLIVPQKIHNIAAGTDLSRMFEQIRQDFHFILSQLRLTVPLFNHTAFQMENGSLPVQCLVLARSVDPF